MIYTTVFFDLDDTLYPASAGVWREIRRRMGQYMIEEMGLPPEQVDGMRQHYLQTYGTTLRGLQTHYQVNTDHFLAYVHDVPLAEYIQPDPALRALLLSMPLRRWVFTNSDQAHAGRVLKVLGLEDCFEGLIDVRQLGFYNKPDPRAYHLALGLAGSPGPQNCLFLDDSAANLAPATRLGMTTVWVNQERKPLPQTPHPLPAPSLEIESVHELPLRLPRIWQHSHIPIE